MTIQDDGKAALGTEIRKDPVVFCRRLHFVVTICKEPYLANMTKGDYSKLCCLFSINRITL